MILYPTPSPGTSLIVVTKQFDLISYEQPNLTVSILKTNIHYQLAKAVFIDKVR